MSFARYPSYKDSGVEWLGEVPGHWDVKRLTAVCVFQSGKAHEQVIDDDGEFICVNSRFVSTEGSSRKFCTANFSPAKKNDILMVMSDLPNGRALAKAFFVDADAPYAVNQRVCILSAFDANPKFLFHLLDRNPLFLLNDDGINQTHLSNAAFTKFPTLIPPPAEQTQIAAFLDRETAKIDALVAEQRRLMALLKEKRQAVISHAVTQGLNPLAPMKPSGIEWLGDVPEHWRVGKCGFYLAILSGFAFPSVGFSENATDTKLLRGINVGISRLKWNETVYWRREPGDGLDLYEMQVGDLVIGMDRPLISEGMRVAKVKESELPCLLLQRVASLKTGNQLDADYLLGLLTSEMFVAHFSPDTTGVSVPHISPEQINNFVIPVPPVAEQKAIVEFVGIELTKFDTLTTEAQRAIDLLAERRTALISAAVTGQIDVRGAF
jgi:type I restriction enzyme S subunit